jgi:GT2 family glycosyltransferase
MYSVSVIICTRNRPQSFGRSLTSVLQHRPTGCEVIVIDQSDDDRTLATYQSATSGAVGVTYVQSQPRGASAARNEGAARAAGELLLFTDDDCTVEAGWVPAWRGAFLSDPNFVIGFGKVSCLPYDQTRGYIAEFNPAEGTHGRDIFRKGAGHIGMGANMAIRRAAWHDVGGFDEGLGPGTRYHGGDDLDMAYRLSRSGYGIRHLGAARVWHHGYRPGAMASRLMQGYVGGIAAMYIKHLRCGDIFAGRLILVETRLHLGKVSRCLRLGIRPIGIRGLVAYVRGLLSGWRHPIDRRHRLYVAEVPSRAV